MHAASSELTIEVFRFVTGLEIEIIEICIGMFRAVIYIRGAIPA